MAEKLGGILSGKMEEFGVPGALVGVWIPGQGNLIIEEDVSDIETGEPISKRDHVRIGSVNVKIFMGCFFTNRRIITAIACDSNVVDLDLKAVLSTFLIIIV